jgi:hypothetical protein
MCFGQKRGAMNAEGINQSFPLNLRYSGQQPMHVRGTATGSLYKFSSLQPVQPVDPRDALLLLASRLFRLSR